MREEKLGKLLNELADATAQPPRPYLAQDIKDQIPDRLLQHRGRMNTIKIIVDLRINRLAAAAVIILTTILLASFLGGQNSTGGGIYRDSKLLIKYSLGGGDGGKDVLAGVSKFYEYLTGRGVNAVYYGDSIDPKDANAVLMHWKLPNGKYRVIFGDLRAKTVSAEELIKLQTRMLQKK